MVTARASRSWLFCSLLALTGMLGACTEVVVDNGTARHVLGSGDSIAHDPGPEQPELNRPSTTAGVRTSLRLATLTFRNALGQLDTLDLDITQSMIVKYERRHADSLPLKMSLSLHARVPEYMKRVQSGDSLATVNVRGIRMLHLEIPEMPLQGMGNMPRRLDNDPVSGECGLSVDYQYMKAHPAQRYATADFGSKGKGSGMFVITRVDRNRRMIFARLEARLVNPEPIPGNKRDLYIEELWLGLSY